MTRENHGKQKTNQGTIYLMNKILNANSKGFDNQLSYYSELIANYGKEIDINPNNSSAYYLRGIAKAKLKDHAGAISDFNNAIRIYPNNSNFYYEVACEKIESKDFTGAISDLNNAIKLNPTDSNNYYIRSNCKFIFSCTYIYFIFSCIYFYSGHYTVTCLLNFTFPCNSRVT